MKSNERNGSPKDAVSCAGAKAICDEIAQERIPKEGQGREERARAVTVEGRRGEGNQQGSGPSDGDHAPTPPPAYDTERIPTQSNPSHERKREGRVVVQNNGRTGSLNPLEEWVDLRAEGINTMYITSVKALEIKLTFKTVQSVTQEEALLDHQSERKPRGHRRVGNPQFQLPKLIPIRNVDGTSEYVCWPKVKTGRKEAKMRFYLTRMILGYSFLWYFNPTIDIGATQPVHLSVILQYC